MGGKVVFNSLYMNELTCQSIKQAHQYVHLSWFVLIKKETYLNNRVIGDCFNLEFRGTICSLK